MPLPHWLARLFNHFHSSRPTSRKRRPERRLQRPDLELLEDRVTPASLLVNSAADNTTDTSVLTLRDAITLVNHAGNPSSLGQSSLPAAWAAQIAGAFGGNDTIQFAGELTGSTITLNGTSLPQLTSNVAIVGPGANELTLTANNQSGIVSVGTLVTVTISGLSLQYGNGSDGGAVYNAGILTLSNDSLSGNSALHGGAIDNAAGTLVLQNSTISGNTATYGGAVYNSATLHVYNDTIFGNSAAVGGGINNSSTGQLTLLQTYVRDNSTSQVGGGIYNRGLIVHIDGNSQINDNVAQGGGGALFNSGTATLNDSSIYGNYLSGPPGTHGGGIYNSGTLYFTNSTVSGNTGSQGGAIFNSPTGLADVGYVHLTYNRATNNGGAFYNTGTLHVYGDTISAKHRLQQWRRHLELRHCDDHQQYHFRQHSFDLCRRHRKCPLWQSLFEQ